MDPDLTIILVGKAGVGKSASGNKILGRAAFESKPSFKPVTTEISEATGRVFGKLVKVIDTPGILDKEDTEEKVKTLCQDTLQSSRPRLFLVVVSVGRFTKEDNEAIEAAMRVLGPQGMRKSYLLFTCGDALKGTTLTDFMLEQDNDSLPDAIKKFAGAYHLFNNMDQDQEQVRNLLLKTGYLRTGPENPPPLDDRRIILLGRPGGGKSSSGNTILGSDQFISDCDFNSVSTECVSRSAQVEGRQVTVVDTPGFTDQVLTPEQLYMEIMKSVVEASPGPHAFVIVVKIARITEADIKLFEILPKMFGDEASKYSMVLFTHGDELRDQSIDQMIQSNTHVSKLVSMCGERYCVFNNNQRGNRQQVRKLLEKIDEMVSANGGKHFTSDMFNQSVQFGSKKRTNFLRRHKHLIMAMLVGALMGAVVGGVIGAVIGGAMGVLMDVAKGIMKGAVIGGLISAGTVGMIGALTSVFHRTKD